MSVALDIIKLDDSLVFSSIRKFDKLKYYIFYKYILEPYYKALLLLIVILLN